MRVTVRTCRPVPAMGDPWHAWRDMNTTTDTAPNHAAAGPVALDDLVTLLDLEPIEVNLFRGRLARREPPARVRRPGRRPGAGRRRPHGRRARPARALAARLLPAPGRPDRADPVRGRPHPRRPQLHHPPRRGDPARQGDLQPAGQLPRRTSPAPTTSSRCRRTCPTAEDRSPTSTPAWSRTRDQLGDWYDRPRPIDLRYVDHDPFSRHGHPSDDAARVAARRRRAPGRSGAARLHRHLRQRHDAARHDACCRSGCRGTAPACRWPASTTRCGSTGRSAPTSGCSTTSARSRPRRRAGSPAGRSSPRDGRLAVTVVQEGSGTGRAADEARVAVDRRRGAVVAG